MDRIDGETYVTTALITTCGSNRVPSPRRRRSPTRRRASVPWTGAQARGALQEAFAERLLADPAAVRARVRNALEQCAEAFFDAAWTSIAVRLATDLRLKNELLKRQGWGRHSIGLQRRDPGAGRQPHHRGQAAGQCDRRPRYRGHLPPQRLRPPRTWWRSTRPGGNRWCSTPWPRRVHRNR